MRNRYNELSCKAKLCGTSLLILTSDTRMQRLTISSWIQQTGEERYFPRPSELFREVFWLPRRVFVVFLVFLLLLLVIKNWRFQALFGKGDFITYRISDRTQLRPEDHSLQEFIPPKATDIRIWSYRFTGRWGGSFRVQETPFESWVSKKSLSFDEGLSLMQDHDDYGHAWILDTSDGPVYGEMHTTKASEYSLYYDEGGLAYFNLSLH